MVCRTNLLCLPPCSILRFENSRFDLPTPKIDCLVHQGCESPALREKSVKSNGVRMSTQKKGLQNLPESGLAEPPEKPKQVERSPLFRGCPHFQITIFGLNLLGRYNIPIPRSLCFFSNKRSSNIPRKIHHDSSHPL